MKEIKKLFLSMNECGNVFEYVKVHKLKNPKSIIIGHMNVNFLRNKLVAVDELVISIFFLKRN